MNMSIDKLKVNVRLRDEVSTALQVNVILKNLGYKSSALSVVEDIYKIDKTLLWENKSLEYIAQQILNKNNSMESYLSQKIEEVQKEIDRLQPTFWNDIGEVLDIKFNGEKETYCYVHLIPINEVYFNEQSITLECKNTIDEMVRNLLILQTKIYIIKKFMEIVPVHYTFEYEGANRAWMFAEFCVDAVVSNSNLNNYIPNPAYKYFYSLKIRGVNVLNSFRELFGKISLGEFFVQVYAFVRDNRDIITQFKNYLY